MGDFRQHRLLLLSNGVSIGIFSCGLSHATLLMSSDGSFIQISELASESIIDRVHLTRFVPARYREYVMCLLQFRNRHSTQPYLAEELLVSGERYCGNHYNKWYPLDNSGNQAEPPTIQCTEEKYASSNTNIHGDVCGLEVSSEPSQCSSITSKLSLCPLKKRVRFDAEATYFTENILGRDNLKQEMCTTVPMEFTISSCPLDLKSLVEALFLSTTLPSSDLSNSEDRQQGSHHSSKFKTIHSGHPQVNCKGQRDIYLTKVLSSTPLGANNSNEAVEHFSSLSADTSLLRNLGKFVTCNGTACVTVEQLDRHVGNDHLSCDMTAASGRSWNGCTFVYVRSDNSKPERSVLKDTPKDVEIHRALEAQAWLSEDGIECGEVGGVISIQAEFVHFQLYVQSIGEHCSKKDASQPKFQHREFTFHLCVFESYCLSDDFQDSDDLMSWTQLTEESMMLLSDLELALHHKQIVIHLISFRDQLHNFAETNPLDLKLLCRRNMGLLYDATSVGYSRPLDSGINNITTSLELYHPNVPRQYQFPKLERKTEINYDPLMPEFSLQSRCSVAVKIEKDEHTKTCLTLMADGSCRGVFRRDAMIMEYLHDLQVVKTLLRDGSERVMSVPLLLQLATEPAVVPKRLNSYNQYSSGSGIDNLLESVARNLRKLLSFRRFAVLAKESDRNKLFVKDKSLSVAVMLAQMRNSNYLGRNSTIK